MVRKKKTSLDKNSDIIRKYLPFYEFYERKIKDFKENGTTTFFTKEVILREAVGEFLYSKDTITFTELRDIANSLRNNNITYKVFMTGFRGIHSSIMSDINTHENKMYLEGYKIKPDCLVFGKTGRITTFIDKKGKEKTKTINGYMWMQEPGFDFKSRIKRGKGIAERGERLMESYKQ